MEVVLEAILDSGFEVTAATGDTCWELDDEESRGQIARVLNVGMATGGWLLVADSPIIEIPVAGPQRRVDRFPVPDEIRRLNRGCLVELRFQDGSELVVVRDVRSEFGGDRRLEREARVLRLPADGVIRPMDLETLH